MQFLSCYKLASSKNTHTLLLEKRNKQPVDCDITVHLLSIFSTAALQPKYVEMVLKQLSQIVRCLSLTPVFSLILQASNDCVIIGCKYSYRGMIEKEVRQISVAR